MAEYGVVLAVITLAVIGAISLLSQNVRSAIDDVAAHSARLGRPQSSPVGGPFSGRGPLLPKRTGKNSRDDNSSPQNRHSFSAGSVADRICAGFAGTGTAPVRSDPVRDRVQQLRHVDGRDPRRCPQGRRRPAARGSGRLLPDRDHGALRRTSSRPASRPRASRRGSRGRTSPSRRPIPTRSACSGSSSSLAASRARQRSVWNEHSKRSRPGNRPDTRLSRRAARHGGARARRRVVVPRRSSHAVRSRRRRARRRPGAALQSLQRRRAGQPVRDQERRRHLGRDDLASGLLANDTIKVTLSRQATGVFTKLFGVRTVTVGSKATARAGLMSEAKYVAPIGVNLAHPKLKGTSGCPCFGAGNPTTLPLGKTGAPGGVRRDQRRRQPRRHGPATLAGWILHGLDAYMPLGDYYSDAGAKWNSSQIGNALDQRIGTELLFPVYDTLTGSGANAQYHVIGWVGFHLTAHPEQGSNGSITGWFTEVVWTGIQRDEVHGAAEPRRPDRPTHRLTHNSRTRSNGISSTKHHDRGRSRGCGRPPHELLRDELQAARPARRGPRDGARCQEGHR